MKIYQRIRDLREDNDEKQTDIANLIGVSEATYRRYEQGKTNIFLEDAEKLSDHYDISLDYLAGRTNDKGGLHCNYLDPEQKKLLNAWEQLSSRQKSIVMASIEEYIDREPRNEERKSVI